MTSPAAGQQDFPGLPEPLDPRERPQAPPLGPLTPQQRERGRHLVLIHDMYRRQVAAVRAARDRAVAGAGTDELSGSVGALALRAGYERFGSFCLQYCSLVSVHHAIEDASIFPAVAAADSRLTPVTARLSEEHEAIHALLVALDEAAAELPADPARLPVVSDLVDRLERELLSHLRYEEESLVDALGFYGIGI